jgi:hypothetical protein
MKTLSKYAGILFFTAAMALPAHAGETNTGMLQARVKVALNGMVQDVKAAGTPAEKREVLNHFIGKIEHRAEIAGKIPFLSADNRAALNMLHGKFGTYKAELQGASGSGVADKDLDAYSSFVQQDLEQAEASWGNGGIYLSTGAVIIILLILILIT